jgi:sulfite exporter TauE/SafE/copper chaperone CopZ
MDKNKFTLAVNGMHCRSCEILIEDSLSQVSDVKKTVVNHKKGTVDIYYDSKKPNASAIEHAIREAGYTIAYDGVGTKRPLLSRNPEDYKDLGIAFLFLLGIYLLLRNFGITSINFGSASNPSSLSVVFLVGLTAGLSTCMALVGGLILGISARHAEIHPEATPMQKFRPHLFFNLGRIGGYALLGGVLGSLGSVLQLSGTALGLLTIIVGLVMLALGMKLTGIFPRMENSGITLPKGIGRFFGIKKHHEKEYSHRGSVITGALTFFLPCGFTQAMQLYAVSTGSFAQGALIMSIFALGTAPGLLGVGGLTSVVQGIFAQRFFKFASIIVILLALFNITNGYNLTGWQLGSDSDDDGSSLSAVNSAPSAKNTPKTGSINDPNVKLENGMQTVTMNESSRGYTPNKFTIKKGVPVKWVINAQDPYSCASSITVSSLKIQKTLKVGENIIEFTPNKTGKISFSCAMGMYTGSFTVIEN